MKQILIGIVSIALPGAMQAQTVVASQGAEYTDADWHITQTIGEPVTVTAGDGTTQLTQGFEQPWADVGTTVDDVAATMPDVSVYPNPVRHVLNIAFPVVPTEMRYELFDALGRSVQRDQVRGTLTELDMERFASGGYVLRLIGVNGTAMRSFKINVTQ